MAVCSRSRGVNSYDNSTASVPVAALGSAASVSGRRREQAGMVWEESTSLQQRIMRETSTQRYSQVYSL